jgi:hypothetical protein
LPGLPVLFETGLYHHSPDTRLGLVVQPERRIKSKEREKRRIREITGGRAPPGAAPPAAAARWARAAAEGTPARHRPTRTPFTWHEPLAAALGCHGATRKAGWCFELKRLRCLSCSSPPQRGGRTDLHHACRLPWRQQPQRALAKVQDGLCDGHQRAQRQPARQGTPRRLVLVRAQRDTKRYRTRWRSAGRVGGAAGPARVAGRAMRAWRQAGDSAAADLAV